MINRNRKLTAFIVFIFVAALGTTIFGGAFLESFNGHSEGESIVLRWNTTTETNLKHFAILRGPNKNNLSEIAKVEPKGDNSYYEYRDESVYKANESVYVYQLKLVDKDNSESLTKHISIVPQVSGVKKTWGSIKALFR